MNCQHYFRYMKSNLYDIEHMMQVNGIKEYKQGQKMCIKHKEFVFFTWSCGSFLELPEINKKMYRQELLNRTKNITN